MKFGMKAMQTFRNAKGASDTTTNSFTTSARVEESFEGQHGGFKYESPSPIVKPNFLVQLLGIPLIAYVLTQIANQVKQDAQPLNWAKIQLDLLIEKLQKSGFVYSDQTTAALRSQQAEAVAQASQQTSMLDMGSWIHFNLFLGAILVVYSVDLIMDMIHWNQKSVKLKFPILLVSVLLLFAGLVSMGWQWVVQGFFATSTGLDGAFGVGCLMTWFTQDWGLVLVVLVAAYGFMAWKRIPFMAMVSPFVIAFSIMLLLMMPTEAGYWWLGDAIKDLDQIQRYRILGIFLYLVGCFLLNVLLVQRLEKSKDWRSESPNVWLLFAVDFRYKKLKYQSEEPELVNFPRFWWVPYFWLFVSALLVILGLYFMIQGDDLLEKQIGAYKGLSSPDFYFERYAFRAMLLGFYYGLLRLLQTFIQWNRIYRLLVELGLLILVL